MQYKMINCRGRIVFYDTHIILEKVLGLNPRNLLEYLRSHVCKYINCKSL